MKRVFWALGVIWAALVITGCGGGGSSTGSGGSGSGGGGTTAAPAAKGTALVTVNTLTNTATVKPLDPSSRAIFSGAAVSLGTIKVNEDAGEVTARQLGVTVTNNTQGPLSNLRFTVSQVTPLTSPVIDDSPNVTVGTFAGTGATGTGSGGKINTPIGGPFGQWQDTDGSVYVASSANACIRKIQNGETSTVISIPGLLPYGLTGDSNFLFFSDYSHQIVYRVKKDGTGSTVIAGTVGVAGDADGVPGTSKLSSPVGLTMDTLGNLYIANLGTGAVREVVNPDTANNCLKLATLSGSYSLADITLDGKEYLVDGQYSSVAKIALIGLNTGTVTTITGTTGTAAVTGPANTVGFNLVRGLAVKGDLIVLSQGGRNQVDVLYRQNGAVATDPTAWVVALVAGTGTAGSQDGTGNSATFNSPSGLSFAPDGSLLISDTGSNKVRRAVISNFAVFDGVGNSPVSGTVSVGSPDTYVANADGNNYPAFVFKGELVPGQSMALNPWAFDLSLGVTSFQFMVTVDGGTSFDAVLDAVNRASAIGSPTDYVRTLTRPSPSAVSILTGRLADLSTQSILFPCFAANGIAFIATSSQVLRVDTDGNVTVIAGSGSTGNTDGIGLSTSFYSITSITCTADGSTVYVADYCAVRRITGQGPDPNNWAVSTVAGVSNAPGYARGSGATARFSSIMGIGLSPNGQNIYVADSINLRVSAITMILGNSPTAAASWKVVDLAGNGTKGFADGVNAEFGTLTGLTVSPVGDIYVSDGDNNRIRKVTTASVTSTLAGNGGTGYVDGPATSAQMNPNNLAMAPSGYLYFVDLVTGIRRISPSGDVETIGSTTSGDVDGNLSQCSLAGAYSIAVSPTGVVWYDSNPSLRSIERIVGL